MCHVNGGHPPLAQDFPEQGQQFPLERCVEIGERLVEEQRSRFQDQGTGDGDALALSAREIRGVTILFPLQADSLQDSRDALVLFVQREMLGGKSERQVAADGEMRPERQVLKDDGEAALLHRPQYPAIRADDFSVQPDEAAIGREKTEDDAQQRRLPRAGRAEDGHDLGGIDRKRYLRTHVLSATLDHHPIDADRRRHAALRRRSASAPATRAAATTSTCTSARAATTGSGPFASSVMMRTVSGALPAG